MQSSDLFNLNFARDFLSKKGVSMLDQVRVTQQAKPRRFRRPRKLIAALTGDRLRQVLDAHAYLWRWLDALSQVVLTHLPQFLLADIGTEMDHTNTHYYIQYSVFSCAIRISGDGSKACDTAEDPAAPSPSPSPSPFPSPEVCLDGLHQMGQLLAKAARYLSFRAGVVLSTLFLFFITTTLTAYILRETQERMLRCALNTPPNLA